MKHWETEHNGDPRYTITQEWYITSAKRKFAFFGFIGCPLTDEELTSLYQRNVKLEKVYTIGCDVNAGFEFEFAVEASNETLGNRT